MEMSSIFSQTVSGSRMEPLFILVGALCFVWLAIRTVVAAGPRMGIRWPRVPNLNTGGVLKAALAAAAPLIVMSPARAVPRDERDHQPPWLETSGFPPPHPLVRAEASRHPAVHTRAARPLVSPLFPRERMQRRGVSLTDQARRGIIDLRRADRLVRKSDAVRPSQSHYTVMPGDTLWDIASRVLGTDDARAIARYWPAIHRENRDVVGADPNLIRPGMVLTLPRKDRA